MNEISISFKMWIVLKKTEAVFTKLKMNEWNVNFLQNASCVEKDWRCFYQVRNEECIKL